ncbi:hypothetical protein IV203_013187 [Nitzschia inconspicua]|uniref:Magnesium transporter n=1 Tax=Nitzschia inconspicua TaxID=303405 RepID=A0A9K3M549_9STRA|nr:hypothetical protein IV203_013187 [Nitzschia inconspicua]
MSLPCRIGLSVPRPSKLTVSFMTVFRYKLPPNYPSRGCVRLSWQRQSFKFSFYSTQSSSLPKEEAFRVTKISTTTGDLETVSLTPSEILHQTSILPRDLVSLALTTNRERQSRRMKTRRPSILRSNLLMESSMRQPPAAILPRKDCILLSFGSIRAVADRKFVYIFDTHKLVSQSFADQLSQLYHQRAVINNVRDEHCQQQRVLEEEENNRNDTACTKPQKVDLPMKDKTNDGRDPHMLPRNAHYNYHEDDEPPELLFLEAVLADTVESSTRRIRIFEPIVDDVLNQIANDDDFSNVVLHQMAPLKDQLQSFDMFVTQAYECLTRLLNDDNEMLKLLLTEQEEARQKNTAVDFERHQHVELLLGVYAQQFRAVQHEANFLLSRIKSKQEFIELELDLYRNRLIRMNVDLAILGVSVGTTTAMAGWFGMNLVNGLESSPTAFAFVTAFSSVSAFCVALYFSRRVSGRAIQQRAKERIDKIRTMTHALSDMTALDHTVKKIVMSGQRMNREEFKRELCLARHSRHISEAEVDLLFEVLNSQDDGFLDHDDFSDQNEEDVKSGCSSR